MGMIAQVSRRRRLAPAALLAMTLSCRGSERAKEPLRVAAAADLAGALEVMAADFERARGVRVTVTYGSSGLLARQIAEGAPFDVFAAASEQYADDAVTSGRCQADSKRFYARGSLVVWARDEASLPRTLADLADPRFARIAIANPAHAPYGRAAREALVRVSAWGVVEKRIVFADNVQQALTFAKSGSADVAIVARSLIAPGKEAAGATREVDEALHAPIEQAAVACGTGNRGDDPRAFVAAMTSDAGQALLAARGFRPGRGAAR